MSARWKGCASSRDGLRRGLQLFADPDAPISIRSAHSEPRCKIHAERPKVVLRCSFDAGAWIRLHRDEALFSEVLARRVEQGCCNATTSGAWRNEETQDRADLLWIGDWLSVERMKQLARGRITP